MNLNTMENSQKKKKNGILSIIDNTLDASVPFSKWELELSLGSQQKMV